MSQPLGQETPKLTPAKGKVTAQPVIQGHQTHQVCKFYCNWSQRGALDVYLRRGSFFQISWRESNKGSGIRPVPKEGYWWFPLSHSYSPESRRGKGHISTLSGRRRRKDENQSHKVHKSSFFKFKPRGSHSASAGTKISGEHGCGRAVFSFGNQLRCFQTHPIL